MTEPVRTWVRYVQWHIAYGDTTEQTARGKRVYLTRCYRWLSQSEAADVQRGGQPPDDDICATCRANVARGAP